MKVIIDRIGTLLGLAAVSLIVSNEPASGTASTHIWAPSTDLQPFGVAHLTYDAYLPVKMDASGHFQAPVTNLGLTLGVIPSTKLQAEVGLDHKAGLGDADRNPMYFNGKIGIPEAALSSWQPAVAVGIFDVGTRATTGYNVVYIKGAKSLTAGTTSLGRLSAGYFSGAKHLLIDGQGATANDGFFGAWERTCNEISPKLTLCAEYMGSKSSYGCWSVGGTWKFTTDIGVIAGYSHFNRDDLVGTATVQLDIDIH